MGLHRSDCHGEWDNMSGIVRAVPLLSMAAIAKQSAAPSKRPAIAQKKRRPVRRKKR